MLKDQQQRLEKLRDHITDSLARGISHSQYCREASVIISRHQGSSGQPTPVPDYMEAEIWHPIHGLWVHIQQVIKNGNREYYTDGKLVLTKEVKEDGTIKEL